MRSSFARKDNKPSLGHVNVDLFVGYQKGGSSCNLEMWVRKLGDKSGSVIWEVTCDSNFHELMEDSPSNETNEIGK